MFNFNENSVKKSVFTGNLGIQLPIVSVRRSQISFNKFAQESFGLEKYRYVRFSIQDGKVGMEDMIF